MPGSGGYVSIVTRLGVFRVGDGQEGRIPSLGVAVTKGEKTELCQGREQETEAARFEAVGATKAVCVCAALLSAVLCRLSQRTTRA